MEGAILTSFDVQDLIDVIVLQKVKIGSMIVGWHDPFRMRQVMVVLFQLHTCLVRDTVATNRDVYYVDPKVLSTRKVKYIVKQLSLYWQIHPKAIPITPSLKSLVYGCKIITSRHVINAMNEPILLPTWHSILDIHHNALQLIIVEKDAIFQRIVQECKRGSIDAVVITGKGFPDENAQFFLKTFQHHFRHIHILVDMDPHGLWIYLTYAKHIKKPKPLQCLNSTTQLSLTKRDITMLNKLMDKPLVSKVATHLSNERAKYELEHTDYLSTIETVDLLNSFAYIKTPLT